MWSHVFTECELSPGPCLPCIRVAAARKVDRAIRCDGRGLLTKRSKEEYDLAEEAEVAAGSQEVPLVGFVLF